MAGVATLREVITMRQTTRRYNLKHRWQVFAEWDKLSLQVML